MKRAKSITEFLVGNYYLLVITLYMFAMIYRNMRVGVYASFFMCVIFAGLMLKGKAGMRIKETDVYVLLFVLYSMISATAYSVNNIPISVFISAASNALLPIVFYLSGRNGIKFKRSSYYIALDVCCLIGIFLLITKPEWYVTYCKGRGISYTRLSSGLGSVAIGTLSTIALIYTISDMIESRGEKGKLQYVFSVAFVFLSMQRSAWAVGILSVFVMHYYVFFKWHAVRKKYLLIELFAIPCGLFMFRRPIINMVGRWLMEKASHGNLGMISSRASQWISGLESSNWIIGSGFGTRGQKAMQFVNVFIGDGGWAVLLCEVGIVGLIIFAIIMIRVIKKGICSFKKLYVPMLIILLFFLQAIGSNVFMFQLLAPFFWMSVGEIVGFNKKDIRKEFLNESTCILSPTVSRN